ncbi:unnamed protein product, partial [marine sediment metagenome]
MKVYYGLDRNYMLQYIEKPMVSVRTIIDRKSSIVDNNNHWFLDSGAYTYIRQYGKYPFTYGKYLEIVNRFHPPLWACM